MQSEFLIVDGHHLAYRCHFALAPLHRDDGPGVPALLAFVRTLQAVGRALRPTHQVVVFDGGLSPARLEACPEYKAQRPPMPEGLREQLPLIRRYLETAAVPALCLDQVEADDIIATLACRAAAEGADVGILSSDKDLYQLVGQRIRMLPPGSPERPVRPDGVTAKFGVPPERLAEWLALTGDTSDNIPGVPGVGPVTATKWLQEFGSIENLYRNAPSVTPIRLRERLLEHRARVERNLDMVRLDTDVDGLPPWRTLCAQEPPAMELARFFTETGVPSLIPKPRQPDLFDAG